MRVDQMFPSKYLKGSDLQGPVIVTIQRVTTESVYRPNEGQASAYVLYCVNGSKGIVLSKALAEGIAEALKEPDTDLWAGRKVTLYPQGMKVAGRDVTAIRARAANGQTQPEGQGSGQTQGGQNGDN